MTAAMFSPMSLKTKSKVVGITTTMKEREIKSLNEKIEIASSYPKLEKIFKEKKSLQ